MYDEQVEAVIKLLNEENYKSLKKFLDEYKGSFSCFFLLKALEDDRCDCPSNHVQVIEKLDALLIDRRPRMY